MEKKPKMNENLEELLSRHFQENTRQILETTREMIQEVRDETREMIQESEHRVTILLEDIRSDVRAIAEGLEMTQQRFERVRGEDRQDIEELDRRVTRLEVRAASDG